MVIVNVRQRRKYALAAKPSRGFDENEIVADHIAGEIYQRVRCTAAGR